MTTDRSLFTSLARDVMTPGEWMAEVREWATSFPQREYIINDSRDDRPDEDSCCINCKTWPEGGR